MSTLTMAAGGGGDALGALLLNSEPGQLIATFAWERLRIDPVPGPRPRSGFTNLGNVDGVPMEITAASDTTPRGRSTLPFLSRETGVRLFVVEAERGAVGVTQDLAHLCRAFAIRTLRLVDIGGDIVAKGREAGIRSPLADALALAGAAGTGLPTTVVVAGPGIDGELEEGTVLDRLQTMGAARGSDVRPSRVEELRAVLDWHPSEASVLLAAAATGLRGIVETRRGDPIRLGLNSATTWEVPLQRVLANTELPQKIEATTSLDAADAIAATYSVSELTYERRKAALAAPTDKDLTELLVAAQDFLIERKSCGIDYVSTRRLMEVIGCPLTYQNELTTALDPDHNRRRSSLWQTSP